VDRKKDLIVCAGAKIYPRDVDEVLFANPKIAEACAIGVPHLSEGQIVKAFVVLKKGETATVDEIVAFCRTKLTPQQLPKEVDFVDALPRSPVGKILRKELRRMHLVKSGAKAFSSSLRGQGADNQK